MRYNEIAEKALGACPGLLYSILPNGIDMGKSEFIIGSIDGEKGQSLRFNYKKGVGKDFATGQTFPSVIHLWAAVRRLSIKEAAKNVAEILSTEFKFNSKVYKSYQRCPKIKEANIVIPAPEDNAEIERVRPNHVYKYRDLDSELIFYIFRFDNPKKFFPVIYTQNGWVYKYPPKPRPIYNGHLLKDFPSAKIIIVEGEKTCDAASMLLPSPEYLCVTWSGGAESIANTDWFGLRGREITIWPDHDDAGYSAASKLKHLIYIGRISDSVSVVALPWNLKKKWDAANALADGWSQKRVEDLLKVIC